MFPVELSAGGKAVEVVLNKTNLFCSNSLLLCNNSVTSIGNTQLSLYMGLLKKSELTLTNIICNRIHASGFVSGFSIRVLFA